MQNRLEYQKEQSPGFFVSLQEKGVVMQAGTKRKSHWIIKK